MKKEGFYIHVYNSDRGIMDPRGEGKYWQDWSQWVQSSRWTAEEAEEMKKAIGGLDEYKGDFVPFETEHSKTP